MDVQQNVPAENDSSHKVTWSNFWKRPEVVVPILVGGALSVWGVTAAQVPKDPVAECHRQYPDAKGIPVRKGENRNPSTYVVEGCRQPGLAGVGDDALWRADLTIYGIPDTALADAFTRVEVYDSKCPALGINYKYDHMGTVSQYRIVVQNQQTVSGNLEDPKSIYSVGTIPPANVPQEVRDMAGSRLLVLNNDRNELESVSCEDFTAAAKRPPLG
ncbi:hypothetical protein [Arthrobacter sp. SAFR-044]|uniref:hypothetical protein n=1 Tax=Arthrobacter sp. SAFR-044 TaxID=3387278 RepID=UPI003F7BFCDC